MIRARTVDEGLYLIRDAMHEGGVRAAFEFDEDSMSAYAQFIDDPQPETFLSIYAGWQLLLRTGGLP